MTSRDAIENLMARYCRLYDDGDLEGYAELFRHGLVSGMSKPEEVIAWHRKNIFFYDGIPKTRHLISNIEIEIDEAAGLADGRSYIIAYQALEDFPLQPILLGSYIDKFHRIDGQWYFASRSFKWHLSGDNSRHSRPDATLPDGVGSSPGH